MVNTTGVDVKKLKGQERNDYVVFLRAQNKWSLRKLAEVFGLSKTAIWKILIKYEKSLGIR